jgi:hypothetical protein
MFLVIAVIDIASTFMPYTVMFDKEMTSFVEEPSLLRHEPAHSSGSRFVG